MRKPLQLTIGILVTLSGYGCATTNRVILHECPMQPKAVPLTTDVSSGGHIAVARQDGSFEVRNIDTGDIRWCSPPGPRVTRLAFSPDGQRLVVGEDSGRVFLFENGGSTQRVLDLAEGLTGLSWDAQGGYLAIGTRVGTLELWHVADDEMHSLDMGEGGVPAFAPKGALLAFAGSKLSLFDFDGRLRPAGAIPLPAPALDARFSPRSDVLVLLHAHGASLFSSRTGDVQPLSLGNTVIQPVGVRFDNTGNVMALFDHRSLFRGVPTPTGLEPLPLPSQFAIADVQFLNDGRLVALGALRRDAQGTQRRVPTSRGN